MKHKQVLQSKMSKSFLDEFKNIGYRDIFFKYIPTNSETYETIFYNLLNPGEALENKKTGYDYGLFRVKFINDPSIPVDIAISKGEMVELHITKKMVIHAIKVYRGKYGDVIDLKDPTKVYKIIWRRVSNKVIEFLHVEPIDTLMEKNDSM